MSGREPLFSIPSAHHGNNPAPLVYSWHPDGSFVASAGQSGVVQVGALRPCAHSWRALLSLSRVFFPQNTHTRSLRLRTKGLAVATAG